MSLRSILATALRGAATALRFAGRATAFAAKAIAVPAVYVTRAVVDTATGVVTFVRQLVAPAPVVSAAEAQAEAYMDAGADEHASVADAATAHIQQMQDQNPLGFETALRAQYPEAALLQDWVRHHAWGGRLYPDVDVRQVPEHVMLWLTSLDEEQLDRVAQAPIARLNRHLRARSERDLMLGISPVLPLAEARAEASVRREREVDTLARATGARRAPAADADQAALDDLLEAAEEAGPAPRPF